MAQISQLKDVSVKQDTGEMNGPYPVGVTFDNVVDSNRSKGNYSLRKFFDNYIDYMTTADFIYCGAEEPQNSHVKIWIDTAHSNQN